MSLRGAAEISDNPPEITSVVVDAEDNPIEEVRVYFAEGPVPLPDIAALTNRNGRFALSAPTSGPYQLGIASDGPAGFLQETTTVEVGEVRSVEFEDRQRVAPGSGLWALRACRG
jgi:Carboxypeptidase regulatory-like domain